MTAGTTQSWDERARRMVVPERNRLLSRDEAAELLNVSELWRTGWEAINGKASFDANPWCWVYEFEVVR